MACFTSSLTPLFLMFSSFLFFIIFLKSFSFWMMLFGLAFLVFLLCFSLLSPPRPLSLLLGFLALMSGWDFWVAGEKGNKMPRGCVISKPWILPLLSLPLVAVRHLRLSALAGIFLWTLALLLLLFLPLLFCSRHSWSGSR